MSTIISKNIIHFPLYRMHQDLSWSSAICIWTAISESSQSLRVAMRLSHDTSTPFPASHSLRTSIVILSGSPRQHSLILATLSPKSSWRRSVPNARDLGPTREGSLILTSSVSVGLSPETAGSNNSCTKYHTYKPLHNLKVYFDIYLHT